MILKGLECSPHPIGSTERDSTVLKKPPRKAKTLREVDDPPPFLGTWRRVYAAVLLYLLATISALYLFTYLYTP